MVPHDPLEHGLIARVGQGRSAKDCGRIRRRSGEVFVGLGRGKGVGEQD